MINTSSKLHKKLRCALGEFRKDYLLYLLVVPGILYFVLFKYVPLYGITIAFREFTIFKGYSDAPWVGLAVFQKMFSLAAFDRAFVNTIIISLAKLLWAFPAPILLSILINEVVHARLKKAIQTSLLLPHFVSWVIIGGIFYTLLSPNSGLIKQVADWLGYQGEIVNVLGDKRYFRSFLVISSIWKEMGYGTIIYLAAITGIDQELYEAARVDGAGKLAQAWHVTLASIRPMIVLMLILRVGALLDAGFDQIFVLTNPLVNEVAEILDTYVYRIGVVQQNYSLGTAVGLFKSLIGLGLVLLTNWIARKIDEDSALI